MRRLVLLLFSLSFLTSAAPTRWVATWAPSPSPQMEEAQMRSAKLVYSNQTIRQIIHTSIGGHRLRVRLANLFSRQTVSMASVHVALREAGSRIVSGSDHELTFAGKPALSIPPNAILYSDPISLDVPVNGDLAISLFIPGEALAGSIHYDALQTSYIGAGNLTAASEIADAQKITSWVFLAGVDVETKPNVAAIGAFGDSITDGARSTVDANHRWPNELASRLLARKGRELAVIDAGIGGNRILHDAQGQIRFGVNALSRFDRDVLDQPGVRYVVLLEGINDLGHAGTSAPESETVSVEDLIAGMRQLIEHAHSRGVKIFGATLTPFEGTIFKGYFTPERETKRLALNQWIRTGGAFDAVIDFDKAAQDPANPSKLLPKFDCGDHLHPNDAGYQAMGDAVDLMLFK